MSVDTLPSGSYRVRWKDEAGAPRSRTFPRGMKAEADDFDREVKRMKVRGELDLYEGGRLTLADYADEFWRPHVEGLAPKTAAVYTSIYDKHVEPRLGNVPLRQLRADRVRRFQDGLARAGVGPAAIEKTMRVLSAILGLAEDDEKIARNPVSKVKIKAAEVKLIRPLTIEQVEALRGRFDARGRMIVSLLAYAGLRPQELHAPYGPRWSDVREQTLLVRSPKTAHQGKAHRAVKLLGTLRQELAEWRLASGRPAGDAYVIPGQRLQEGWSQASYHRWRANHYKTAVAAIGRPEATPYYLRHTYVNLRLMEGRPPAWVAEQMGHTLDTLDRDYRHISADLGDERIDIEAEVRRVRDGARLRLAR
jgi:site-specific recombinase XerD